MADTEYDWEFLRKVYAKTCDENEFKVFQHLTETYNLDPISKEIWCIKSGTQPARIFVSRDGHLSIAQRTGNFGGMNTTFDFGPEQQYMEVIDKWTKKVTRVLIPFSATTTIYRKDSSYPTIHTVFWDEYGGNQSLWAQKPKTMLQKVAECQCLRRAFDMHGFYAREEFQDINSDEEGESSPKKKEVKQASLQEEEEEEIDWTRTRKTKPSSNDYDERQKAIVEGNYDDYGLDKAVFEKAKIGNTGFWDREIINYDYKKQLTEKGII